MMQDLAAYRSALELARGQRAAGLAALAELLDELDHDRLIRVGCVSALVHLCLPHPCDPAD